MTALIMSKLYFLPITTKKRKPESSRHVAPTRPRPLLVPVHKVHNVLQLTVFQLKTTWQLGNQLVLIVAVVEVLLQEDLFHF